LTTSYPHSAHFDKVTHPIGNFPQKYRSRIVDHRGLFVSGIMNAARSLKQKIDSRKLTTGMLAIDHVWTDLVEISARAGLDYLIVDMEHGAAGPDLVAEVCAAGRRAGFPVLVRPRSNDYTSLRLAVDLGPCGFLLACVESPTDLDVARDAVCMPPRGRRRPGGMGNRWVSDYGAEAWRREFEDDFVVLPQIETRSGMKNVAAIAAHDLTTAVAIGPYDLSAELGVCGDMDSPVLREALDAIRKDAQPSGKPTWMIGSNAAQLARDGWRFLCIGEPTWILTSAIKDKLTEARAASVPQRT
jgi:2-keto-3-deoxy-L-rhamnonate aldolase RhmA